MFRQLLIAGLLAAGLAGSVAASAQAPAATAAAPAYSTSETSIGDLLDNPATKAVLDKHMPGFAGNPQIDMARGMTLKQIQQFAGDAVTDELERRATMTLTSGKATTHELELETRDGESYIGRITATELLGETRHGDVAVFLTEDERVLVYDGDKYAYYLIDDPEEGLRGWLVDDDDYVTVMHQLGIKPTIELDLSGGGE